jgi:ABC-type transport system involved in multi-copper enzyme maturation permease subunit
VIALVRSELLRFRSRRMVKALAGVAVLGMVVTAVIIAINSHPGSADAFSMANAENSLKGSSSLLVIAGWVIGASMIGADWQTGTMTTLLTWEPRRLRVLIAKAIAAAVGVFALVFVLELIFTGLLALVASTRGVGSGAEASLLGLDARIAGLAAFGGILGLGLAGITRNTAAAIGIAFAYLAIVEALIRGFFPGWAPWLLGDNGTVFLIGRDSLGLGRTTLGAALVLTTWCAVFLVAAAGTFLARDVD